MSSLRCRMIVQQELDKIGVAYLSVELGLVETQNNISNAQIEELRVNLKLVGLEIIDNKKNILIDKIKIVIIEMIQNKSDLAKINYSDFISKKLDYNYTYLSNIFSEGEGITIQHFVIICKIEKVKEFLLYDQLSLKEIAERMNYSSASHLSNQFKKITGMTPSFFCQSKKIG